MLQFPFYLKNTLEELKEQGCISGNHLFDSHRLSEATSWLIRDLKKLTDGKVTSAGQLRASVISNFTRRYSIRQAQHMAGHRYISSTEAYRRPDTEALRKELEKRHPFG